MVIQLTDDEKFLFKEKLKLEECHGFAIENAKDIIAIGFDPERTFIFSNLDYMGYVFSVYAPLSPLNTSLIFKQVEPFTPTSSKSQS